MRELDLELPAPPSANTMFPTGKHGKRFLSPKGKKYREDVYAAVLEQLGVFKPMTSDLVVSVWWNPPDRRRRDIDNICKGLFDALQHANVYMDDSQIVDLHIRKLPVLKGGKISIVILEE
jgi:crossover junction endodeoxyribonuclease RusA